MGLSVLPRLEDGNFLEGDDSILFLTGVTVTEEVVAVVDVLLDQ